MSPAQPHDPVLSHVCIPSVSVTYYDDMFAELRRVTEFPAVLPQGMRAHLAGEHDGQLEIIGGWDSQQDDQTFFRTELSGVVSQVVPESGTRGDFLRKEYRLLDFVLGARAPQFLNTRHPDVPDSISHLLSVDLGDAPAEVAEQLYADVAASIDLQTALDGDLVLHSAARTENGWIAAEVWTDAETARLHYAELVANASKVDANAKINLVSFPTHVFMVSAEAVLEFNPTAARG